MTRKALAAADMQGLASATGVSQSKAARKGQRQKGNQTRKDAPFSLGRRLVFAPACAFFFLAAEDEQTALAMHSGTCALCNTPPRRRSVNASYSTWPLLECRREQQTSLHASPSRPLCFASRAYKTHVEAEKQQTAPSDSMKRRLPLNATPKKATQESSPRPRPAERQRGPPSSSAPGDPESISTPSNTWHWALFPVKPLPSISCQSDSSRSSRHAAGAALGTFLSLPLFTRRSHFTVQLARTDPSSANCPAPVDACLGSAAPP
ncbi:hypothetical protein HRG_012506 [Hirsutella rhossiliensis]